MTAIARVRPWQWVALGLAVIVAVAGLDVALTASRPGGRMDPAATGPDGAHALVTLLRDRGVDVAVADTIGDAERAARPDALVLVAETARIDEDRLRRVARLPGDLLLVQPDARARGTLAAELRTHGVNSFILEPDCDLREADRSGRVDLGASDTYVAAGVQSVRSCYHGALVLYRSGDRTITVIGSTSFMTNSGLGREGNAALAMNLAGSRTRLVWYAPQRFEGGTHGTATIFELIPKNVTWLVWQLCLALALAALWKGRRIGPLVTEQLPVTVRASEAVEGLGRLYQSHRARDRAADALRTATLQRLSPRLGLGAAPAPPVVVETVARHIDAHPDWVWHLLFGPSPDSDTGLVQLARVLDDIERQVTAS